MKRCFYIANSYDGAYFVLTDDMSEYFKKMMAYMANLEKSGKCNHYSFGSVEMSEREYEEFRTEASNFEKERIAAKKEDNDEQGNLNPGVWAQKKRTSEKKGSSGLRLV